MSGTSNHYDAMTEVKSIIDGLSLSGLTGGTVIQEVAQFLNTKITLPFVSISPYGPEKMGDEYGFNDRDSVDYGILVAIVGKPDISTLETRLGWRQKMRRNLNNRQLTGGQNWNLVVEPGNAVEVRAWYDLNTFVSGFVVRARYQELRT